MRIPFIDSQTRVAQTNSIFWLAEYQRNKSAHNNGQIYKYPCKKWYKHRRVLFESNDSNPIFHRTQSQSTSSGLSLALQQSENLISNNTNNFINENSNSMDSMSNHANTHSLAQITSSSSQLQLNKQASNNDDYGVGNSNDEWAHQQHHLMHEDSFENFDMNDDDSVDGDGDYDELSSKRKKKRVCLIKLIIKNNRSMVLKVLITYKNFLHSYLRHLFGTKSIYYLLKIHIIWLPEF